MVSDAIYDFIFGPAAPRKLSWILKVFPHVGFGITIKIRIIIFPEHLY